MSHHVNRKEYWVIFAVLTVLTILEVGVAMVHGIPRSLMIAALILLAVTKALCVGLFYMHLKHETKVMRLTVLIPLATPALFAAALIVEAAARRLG